MESGSSRSRKWFFMLVCVRVCVCFSCPASCSMPDEVSRVLPSLVMADRASARPKVAAHVTGSFAPELEQQQQQDGGGGWSSKCGSALSHLPISPLSLPLSVSAGRRVQGQKIWWWEGQKGLAFLQDVQLVQGELVVPRPGLYYVYAQTYFRHTHSLDHHYGDGEEETEEEEEGRGRPLLQYVYKKVGGAQILNVI